jgi:hypothetical protein
MAERGMAMSPADPTQGISRAVPPIVIEELEKRFHEFPVPDKPFDPPAHPELLEQYGLPPRPNPATQPLLSGAWDRAFGKPLKLQQFSVEEKLIDNVRYRPQVRRVNERLVTATRFETSRNWSGAYITANRGKHLIQIWGSWTIPGNLQRPLPQFQGPQGIDYVCSNWIGLDGQRLYFDSSLPQIGTQSALQANGTTKAEAWIQWWARGSLANKPPVPLPNFTVMPGDQVSAVLTVYDPHTVIGVMVNLSAQPLPTATSVLATPPPVTLPDGTMAMPAIAGATAEWVLERPAVYPPQLDPFGEPLLNNFPDYGETEFDLCLAVEGDSVNIGSLPTGLQQVLEGARRIRMFDVPQNPERARLISMGRRMSDTVVRARYGGFRT